MVSVLLLAEGDPSGPDALVRRLASAGHQVDRAGSWREGLSLAASQLHHIVLVEAALPEIGGLAVVRLLRACGVATPVLALSASEDAQARRAALDAGADDHLAAPFSDAQLLDRIDALARPPASRAEPTILRVADLALDLQDRTVVRAARSIRLRPRDFDVLACLMRHRGRAVPRARLLQCIWNRVPPHTRVLEASVRRIRAKVDRGFPVELIHTVPGLGYCLVDDD